MTQVLPTGGSVSGNEVVSLNGTGFTGATAVNFGSNAATCSTACDIVSDTHMDVVVPAATAPGTVDVTVTGPNGTSAPSSTDKFTYFANNGVDSSGNPVYNPTCDPTALTANANVCTQVTGGSLVLKAGTNSLTLGGVNATFAGSYDPTSQALSVGDLQFVSPLQGTLGLTAYISLAGGTAGPLTGTYDPTSGAVTETGDLTVNLAVSGTTLMCSYQQAISASGTLSAPAPTSTPGVSEATGTLTSTGNLTITNNDGGLGCSTAEQILKGGTQTATFPVTAYLYSAPVVPAVTSISPATGPAAGGTSVTITGTGFTGATAVDFGTAPATGVTVNSDTSITATSPSGTAGSTVDVTVKGPGGTSTAVAGDKFTYASPPSVTGISPATGSASGGTSVTITGTGFTGATAVDFGTAPATGVTVNSDTSITATSPSGTAGATVDVTVTTPNGTSSPVTADQFTYAQQGPVITGITPSQGPAAGDTQVTITGSGFTGATAVNFGANPAVTFSVDSDTQITAVSPTGTAGTTVDITVTVSTATSSPVTADQFTYQAGPVITGISPTSGSTDGGTTVTITGKGFAGALAVSFGTTPAASYTVNSDTSITATSPPQPPGPEDITVVTPNGFTAPVAADVFTFVQPKPVVTAIHPTSGPTAGGTTVTITGTDLAGATAVDFGTAAGTITADTQTSITATSPAGAAGPVDVTVTTGGGTSAKVAGDVFTYVPPAPTLTAISPSSGTTAGGTTVTLTGTNLAGATAVNFGSTAGTVTADTDTSITVTSPAENAGKVSVTVVTAGGTSNGEDYTYVVPAPTLTAISPSTGTTYGGTTVTLTGTNLAGATAVNFGSTAGTVTADTDTSITVTSPAENAGKVSVTVVTAGGTSNGEDYTYVVPVPVLTKIQPSSGAPGGGTTVTLTGTGLAGATAVDFGTNAGSITANTATSITVTSPAGTGTVQVTVVTAGGTSNGESFSYVVPAPTLTAISPSSGTTAGGTTVTLTGTNLSGASAVNFGSTAGTVTANSDTSITVTSPAEGAGKVSVTVVTAGGTSNGEDFTFVPPIPVPMLSAISPTSGSTAGGTTVTLTGKGLDGATSVKFGSTAGTITANTATSVTVTSPAGSAGAVDVTVTTAGGTSNPETFTYVKPTGPVPTVLRVFPSSGPTRGYSLVWVFGGNFTGVSKVTFGGKQALYRVFSQQLLITLSPPAASTGTVDIQVTNGNGTSATSAADHFTYARQICFLWFCFG